MKKREKMKQKKNGKRDCYEGNVRLNKYLHIMEKVLFILPIV